MGRPSKLTDRQWAEIGRRLAQGGEGNGLGDLAKEFKVSKATLSTRFSKRIQTVQTLATTLATTELEIERLPITEQCSIRSLADQLKGISSNLASAAESGAKVSAKLAQVAVERAKTITKDSNTDDLRPVAALLDTANRASTIGMGLLAANKGKATEGTGTLESLITGEQPA